jgi:hypothetical protein
MTSHTIGVPDDPLGCREGFHDALSDPDLTALGPAGERAAFRLAVAYGRCRLFGMVPGDPASCPLTTETANRAAAELARLLPLWITEARQVDESWETARDPAEADDLCAGILGAHIDARAALLAIEEAAGAAAAVPFGAPLDELEEAIRAHVETLSTLVGTLLLENWRAHLAEPFRQRYFWWIDELEAMARRVEAEAARTMPPASTWNALRQAFESLVGGEPMLAALIGPHGLGDSPEDQRAPQPRPKKLCWISPDGEDRAELWLPGEMGPEEQQAALPLNFTARSDDSQLTGPRWTGVPICLAGVRSQIDERGQAWFAANTLYGAPLRLTVGADEAVWSFQPAGDEPSGPQAETGQ